LQNECFFLKQVNISIIFLGIFLFRSMYNKMFLSNAFFISNTNDKTRYVKKYKEAHYFFFK